MKIINFMKLRKLFVVFSVVLVLGSCYSLMTKGLVLGLDFTGGTQIELGYPHPVKPQQVREQLEQAGFTNPVVVNFGAETDILIKLQESAESGAADDAGNLETRVTAIVGDQVELRRIDYVGPQVGEELRDEGGLGLLVALLAIMLYVAVRFQYKFSVGAVVALAHDVIITLGFFSFFGLEFDLTVLAAVLAVIGYSLNDTIVVFDRVRENFRLIRKATSIEVVNESLTQTLVRTLITSLTTLLVLIALFVVGGQLIHNFSIALIVGVCIGTYSSIYVAVSMLLAMNIQREDLLPPVKENDEEFDGLP